MLQGPQALHVQSTENNRTKAFNRILNALGSCFKDLTPKMTYLPGQILVLHEADSDGNPIHAFPPWNGPFVDLERVILPEPHVFEQVLQELQVLHVQSTENNDVQFRIKASNPNSGYYEHVSMI